MQFSYVITYRSDQEIRAANVFAVLRWLSEISDIEVVLVEQDSRPRLAIDLLPANCTYHFVHNAGPFNKAWGLNVGFKKSAGSVVGFGDADMVMNAEALMASYERCHSEFEAMKPYGGHVDLTPEESQSVRGGNWNFNPDRKGLPRNREGIGEFVCFCGGLFLVRRGVYEELGGFDERFLGWGGEDDAMSSKLSRLGRRSSSAGDQVACHLWHERDIAARYFHPHYQNNVALVNWYTTCDIQSLMQLCQQDRQSMGRPDKYGPCGP